MKINFKEIFYYPSKDAQWWKKVLIGGILGILPVVNFLSVGYLMEIFKKAIHNEPRELPEWEGNWKPFFIQGLIAVCLGIAFVVPVFLLGTVSAALAAVVLPIGVVLGVMALGAGLFLAYGAPFILGAYLETGDLRNILHLKEIAGKLNRAGVEYTKAFIIIWALMLTSFLLFNTIPFIGFLLWAFAGFYLGTVGFRMFGEVYPVGLGEPGAQGSACSTVDNH